LAKIQSGDHGADFALGWELKDLDLMRASAGSSAAPIAVAIADRWRTLVDHGFGSLDVSAARLGLDDESDRVTGPNLGADDYVVRQ
jgi:3-hydroxyisobutyrate dehydrogenase-like beta-hydroxyacid dehydrogenase